MPLVEELRQRVDRCQVQDVLHVLELDAVLEVFEDGLAGAQQVPILQLGALDSSVVDERAVGRLQIDHDEVPEHAVHDGMTAADQITIYAYGALVAATDRNFLVRQVDAPPHLRAGHDHQARLSGTLWAFGWE